MRFSCRCPPSRSGAGMAGGPATDPRRFASVIVVCLLRVWAVLFFLAVAAVVLVEAGFHECGINARPAVVDRVAADAGADHQDHGRDPADGPHREARWRVPGTPSQPGGAGEEHEG